jgi:N-acetyl-beta-hexosaminidase
MVNPKIISSIHNEKIFLDLMNEVKNLPSEGYALSINNRGVVIIGKDEAGLYYGVVTFMQIVKGSLIKEKKPLVKK